ncbi:MAG: sigma-70 family RNA polymerase sigma factor [Opitutales bacterium]|nr:sigma-70 family RNA polymerase sigma factor [Opitutales bacterium]
MEENFDKREGFQAEIPSQCVCDEDSILMLETAKGGDHAFRMLVEKWKNALVNFFYRSTANASTSEDLAQQTFINLYRARESYKAKAKFSTYLFSIARHILINEYRSSSRRIQSVELNPETDSPSAPNYDLETAELEEIFEKTIALMPENQRTAILLLKQQELSYEEIADAMDASVGAVKTWIFRARTTLRAALQERII